MQIEVATIPGTDPKTKGDLLEKLTDALVKAQHYTVTTQLRLTGVELDLLCNHSVSNATLYVECKAHRDALSSAELRQLIGTVYTREYDAGWLVSTGPLSKDAKGWVTEWEAKPAEKRSRLLIYTADRIVEALRCASVIVAPPMERATDSIGTDSKIGDWTLLITQRGIFWCAPVLASGLPRNVLVFDAGTGRPVQDSELLTFIRSTDTTLSTMDFAVARTAGEHSGASSVKVPQVVQVQSGVDWADYRPARPEDFVGRKDHQTRLLHFFELVRGHSTPTRVFAITGDSGMGKSSLIAKLRDRSRNPRHRHNLFFFAVDVRAASDQWYVHAAVLAAFRAAAEAGFLQVDTTALEISNPADVLASPSLINALGQLVLQRP